jgi:hypothetical protein
LALHDQKLSAVTARSLSDFLGSESGGIAEPPYEDHEMGRVAGHYVLLDLPAWME